METPRSICKALPVRIGVVFLIFSLLASSAIAVPLSRGLKFVEASPVVVDLSAKKEILYFGPRRKVAEGRELIIETNDYGSAGANNKHDPPRGT